MGAAAHFLYPYRDENKESTPLYAAPAIYKLIHEFEKYGALREDVEVQIFGGGAPLGAEERLQNLASNNVKVALELLFLKNYIVHGEDIFGYRGRKVLFNSSTGETIVAKLNDVRNVDWIITGGVLLDREEASDLSNTENN